MSTSFSWTLIGSIAFGGVTPLQTLSLQKDTPARDFKLDSSGDLFIGRDLALVSGVDAIAQSLRIRLNFVQGEWFADKLAGIPFMTEVLGKKTPNLNAIRGFFVETILETVGVAELLQLDLTFDGPTRVLTVNGRVSTDTGELIDFKSTGAADL